MRKQKKHVNSCRRRLIVGVTGNFGTGKSTVASMLRSCGASVVDADKIARSVLARPAVSRQVVKAFGEAVLRKNKTIDRKKLAAIVFESQAQVRRLNRITHPHIIRLMDTLAAKAPKPVVVLDVPLLIEAGLHRSCDYVIVASARPSVQVGRLLKKTHLSRREIILRISRQMPLRRKETMADWVIDNNGSRQKTALQVRAVWQALVSGKKTIGNHTALRGLREKRARE